MAHDHLRRYPRVESDFPVEYTYRGQTFKAHATVLGGGGLVLKAKQEMTRGETLTVIFRPAKRLPKIEARAIVRTVSGSEGTGIEFTSMRPEDHQEILRYIHKRIEEKRKGQRAPFVAQVLHQNSAFLGLSRNISAGGIFVEAKESLPIGSKLELRFHLDDGDPIIVATGEVAYVVEKLGLGVRFIDLAEADQQRIETYVAKGITGVAPAASAAAS